MTKRTMSPTGRPLGHCPSHWPHMRQKYGLTSSNRAVRIFWSVSVNCCAITLKFCSSWSMSVMLGTVVAMAGFLIAHLSAAGAKVAGRGGAAAPRPPGLALTFMGTTPTPSPFSVSRARPRRRGGPAAPGLSHHLHGHQTHARLVQLLEGRAPLRGGGEVVLRLDHLQLGCDDAIDDGRQRVRAHADEPHLALLLGLALRVDQIVGDLRRVA